MDRGLAVVFAGTPDFAVPSLDAIAASRHRHRRPCSRSPTARAAAAATSRRARSRSARSRWDFRCGSRRRCKGGEAARAIASFAPDVMVVVAYGLLLPPEVLAVPRLGCLNVHASLLPRWRGAAPVARAILAGDARTGVCIMRMEAGLDTGPGDARARASRSARAKTAGELEVAARGGGRRRDRRGARCARRGARRVRCRRIPRMRPTPRSSPRPRRASTGARARPRSSGACAR